MNNYCPTRTWKSKQEYKQDRTRGAVTGKRTVQFGHSVHLRCSGGEHAVMFCSSEFG